MDLRFSPRDPITIAKNRLICFMIFSFHTNINTLIPLLFSIVFVHGLTRTLYSTNVNARLEYKESIEWHNVGHLRRKLKCNWISMCFEKMCTNFPKQCTWIGKPQPKFLTFRTYCRWRWRSKFLLQKFCCSCEKRFFLGRIFCIPTQRCYWINKTKKWLSNCFWKSVANYKFLICSAKLVECDNKHCKVVTTKSNVKQILHKKLVCKRDLYRIFGLRKRCCRLWLQCLQKCKIVSKRCYFVGPTTFFFPSYRCIWRRRGNVKQKLCCMAIRKCDNKHCVIFRMKCNFKNNVEGNEKIISNQKVLLKCLKRDKPFKQSIIQRIQNSQYCMMGSEKIHSL